MQRSARPTCCSPGGNSPRDVPHEGMAYWVPESGTSGRVDNLSRSLRALHLELTPARGA